jgi:hypothetical protein
MSILDDARRPEYDFERSVLLLGRRAAAKFMSILDGARRPEYDFERSVLLLGRRAAAKAECPHETEGLGLRTETEGRQLLRLLRPFPPLSSTE